MKKIWMVYSVEEQLIGAYNERINLIGVFGTNAKANSAVEKAVNEALNGKKQFIDYWQRQGREAFVTVSETPSGNPYIVYEIGTENATDFTTEDRTSIRWYIEEHEVIE